MNSSPFKIDDYVERWLKKTRINHTRLLKSENLTPGSNRLKSESRVGWLSVGLPKSSFSQNNVTDQLSWWFPGGLPSGKSVALVSSRIGRRPDTKPYLFDALRTVCSRCDPQNEFFISHPGISTDKFVRRAAELHSIPFVELRPMPENPDETWFEETWNQSNRSKVGYYEFHTDFDNTIADELVLRAASQLYVLSVRNRGKIQKALEARLGNSAAGDWTFCLNHSGAISNKLSERFQDRGAIPWLLIKESPVHPASSVTGQIVNLADFKTEHNLEDYLAHWTRARHGPWPDETNWNYLDNLIFGLPRSNHSKYAALMQILASSRILASNQFTRDKTPVVSFTARTLDQFPDLRVFRNHLNRWDFEMVGVAIRRDKLLGRARAVVYGSDHDWLSTPEAERPFFQYQGSRTDWTNEHEWRVVGDVDLKRFEANDAFVFVDCWQQAKVVSTLSKWPVVVVRRDESAVKKSG